MTLQEFWDASVKAQSWQGRIDLLRRAADGDGKRASVKRRVFHRLSQRGMYGRLGTRPCWACVDRVGERRHHVVPLSAGGDNSPSNVLILCERCEGMAHRRAVTGKREAGR